MTRTTLLSLAMFVLCGAMESHAAAPPAGEKEGFRVYSVRPRCGQRQQLGVYETGRDALHAAAEFRARGVSRIEVTTGREGKQVPTSQPVLYHVYTRSCPKSGWHKEAAVVVPAKLAEISKSFQDKNIEVAFVADHSPRELFHVYGGGCSRSWRLIGTYASAEEACKAAHEVRTVQKLRNCLVTTGDKGDSYWTLGVPTAFDVYVQGCKSGWVRVATKSDARSAEELATQRKQGLTPVEVVQHFVSK